MVDSDTHFHYCDDPNEDEEHDCFDEEVDDECSNLSTDRDEIGDDDTCSLESDRIVPNARCKNRKITKNDRAGSRLSEDDRAKTSTRMDLTFPNYPIESKPDDKTAKIGELDSEISNAGEECDPLEKVQINLKLGNQFIEISIWVIILIHFHVLSKF